MANVQTITPTVGQGCIYTAQGAGLTPGYSAIDDRRAGLWGPQEGVLPTDANAGTGWECVERAAGANSQIQINANLSCARVQGDTVTAQGLYTVAPHSAVVLLDITAAHATLPRIDQVILEVLDNAHDASGSSLARLRILDGTPTSGATLDNRLGVAALPSNAIRLCDFLVPLDAAGAVSLDNAEIRDRRPWARGATYYVARTGADASTTSSSAAELDPTNLKPRLEVSGNPVVVSIVTRYGHSVASGTGYIGIAIDGAVGFSSIVGAAKTGYSYTTRVEYVSSPSAGSHQFSATYAVNDAGTFTIYYSSATTLRIQEIVGQNARNNSTTTG